MSLHGNRQNQGLGKCAARLAMLRAVVGEGASACMCVTADKWQATFLFAAMLPRG